LGSVLGKKLSSFSFDNLSLFSDRHAFKFFIINSEPIIDLLSLESRCFHMEVIPESPMVESLLVMLDWVHSLLNILNEAGVV
jgi:hypothetical protein